MATLLPARAGYVCQRCQHQLISATRSWGFATPLRHTQRPRTNLSDLKPVYHVTRNAHTLPAAPSLRSQRRVAAGSRTSQRPEVQLKPGATKKSDQREKQLVEFDVTDPAEALRFLQSEVNRIIALETIPDELDVLETLDRLLQYSNLLVFGQVNVPDELESSTPQTDSSSASDPASSTLEDLKDESDAPMVKHEQEVNMSIPFRENATTTVCQYTYDLVRDPKIFITPPILSVYVHIQSQLGRPEYLPEIFFLYSNKPVPKPGSYPIKYSDSWPDHPKNAVPAELSHIALEAAVMKKDLPLALSIIDTTVATRAFRINKLLRKASLPIAAVGATPFIAWAGADWLSKYQDVWDPEMAKWTALAACAAYLGTVTTLGFVAVTTYNDQMERVVWTEGTKLRERWLREEERLYFDRVAVAWGFREKWRWGEEQGEEWEALREVIGVRGMVLDKSSLMEGME